MRLFIREWVDRPLTTSHSQSPMPLPSRAISMRSRGTANGIECSCSAGKNGVGSLMGQFLASGTLRPWSRNLNRYPPQSLAGSR